MFRSEPTLSRLESSMSNLITARWLPVAGSLIAILGARITLIGVAGNPTPFWDQWDAEGVHLFIPWLTGSLGFNDLVAAHNEHRIFFTRILSLIIFELVGNWNTLAEMVVNSILQTLSILVLFFFLRRVEVAGRYGLIALFVFLLFGFPMDAENLLWGFQSQFCLLMLLSIISVSIISRCRSLSIWWVLGLLTGAAAFLVLASGALTLLAAAGLMVLQLLTGGRERNAREWAGIATALMVVFFQIELTPIVAQHAELRAHGLGQFIMSFSRTTGWPLVIPLLGPIIMNMPTAVLLARIYKLRLPITDPRWRIVGLVLWVGLQASSIAYGRAGGPVASRYVDIFALSALLNLVALLVFAAMDKGAHFKAGLIASDLWIALVAGFIVLNCVWLLPGQPAFNTSYTRSQVANVQAYIAKRDIVALTQPRFALPSWRPVKPDAQNFDIPYFDAKRLANVLDSVEIRGSLPAMFGASSADRELVRSKMLMKGGLNLQPNVIAVACRWFGGLLLAIGLMSVLVAFASLSKQSSLSLADFRRD